MFILMSTTKYTTEVPNQNQNHNQHCLGTLKNHLRRQEFEGKKILSTVILNTTLMLLLKSCHGDSWRCVEISKWCCVCVLIGFFHTSQHFVNSIQTLGKITVNILREPNHLEWKKYFSHISTYDSRFFSTHWSYIIMF